MDKLELDAAGGQDRLALLHSFVTVVDAGSLSRAAARLGTTQPTISRRLQQLEALLGLNLLQRTTRGVRVTEDGQRCAERARELLGDWDALATDLRAGGEQARGNLRVVAPHAFGQAQLVEPLADFLAANPEVSVEWLLHDRLPDFARAGIDCAIHVGDVDDESLVAIGLGEVTRVIIAAPSLLARHGGRAETLAEVGALPWLAFGHFYRTSVRLRDTASGELTELSITPRLTTDSLFALRNAVLMGCGVAVVSAWSVIDDIAAGRLVRLLPGWQAPPLPVRLLYPQASHLPARMRKFIELMRERLPRIAGVMPPGSQSAGDS